MNEPRVAVVTGAGSGLGREFSRALADAGFAVALLGRTPESLAATQASLADPGRALVIRTDVTVPGDVDAAFDAVLAEWGRVDVLVNNAGMFGPPGEPDEVDVDTWRRVVDTNLTGMFLCARRAYAAMRRQDPSGGRIINNGSISAQVPRPHSIAYAVTKHGVTGLTRSIALDGRPHRIRCSQIDIGNASTDMTARMAAGVLQADGSLRAEPTFDAVHAARAVVSLAELPLDVEVPFLTMTAGGMPYLGRG